jgi:hypothetical protein
LKRNGPASQEGKDSSFLKKRSKKLLQIAPGVLLKAEAQMLAETDKSFLVLFFKKELLFLSSPLLCIPWFAVSCPYFGSYVETYIGRAFSP